MEINIVSRNGMKLAVLQSSDLPNSDLLITDLQSALDLMATIGFQYHCQRIILPKEALLDDFFDLSTGFAGEILQKFVNYSVKLAIYGDFSLSLSPALKAFIYESNKGNHICFFPTLEEAIEHLSLLH